MFFYDKLKPDFLYLFTFKHMYSYLPIETEMRITNSRQYVTSFEIYLKCYFLQNSKKIVQLSQPLMPFTLVGLNKYLN